MAVFLITGHNHMNRHNAIILCGWPDGEYSGCRHCDQDEESSYHVFARCDKFTLHRRNWFLQDQLDAPFVNIKARQIMGFLKDAKIQDLSDYDPG